MAETVEDKPTEAGQVPDPFVALDLERLRFLSTLEPEEALNRSLVAKAKFSVWSSLRDSGHTLEANQVLMSKKKNVAEVEFYLPRLKYITELSPSDELQSKLVDIVGYKVLRSLAMEGYAHEADEIIRGSTEQT